MKHIPGAPKTCLEPFSLLLRRHRCGGDVMTRLGVYVCGGHRDASRWWARCVLSHFRGVRQGMKFKQVEK